MIDFLRLEVLFPLALGLVLIWLAGFVLSYLLRLRAIEKNTAELVRMQEKLLNEIVLLRRKEPPA